ncbi:MAG: hypothetical protein JO202_04230 [Ktedonobacteraceae bacterium]|nr:hypothetical protein [Ktedonobacteraceae bacterium]
MSNKKQQKTNPARIGALMNARRCHYAILALGLQPYDNTLASFEKLLQALR